MAEFTMAEVCGRAKIKVFGVGGGGGNAVNNMVDSKIQGVEFITGNTDLQDLERSKADVQLQLGPHVSGGLGAGAKPDVGCQCAEESIDIIRESLQGAEMVFVAAGLGGGTGTGAAPIIARVAKEIGALTVAVVTKPFGFEGPQRMKIAEKGWKLLKEQVDTIITIPNDRVLALSQKNMTFVETMRMVDDVLVKAVKGITDLINKDGYINPDFADICTVMNEMGTALMGSGSSVGENRAKEAVKQAIESPLLEDVSINGARSVLVNMSTRRESLTMHEVTEVTSRIQQEVHENAQIIMGVIFDEDAGEELRVTVVATGIQDEVTLEPLPEVVPVAVNGNGVLIDKDEAESQVAPARQPQTNVVRGKAFGLNVNPLDEKTLDTPAFMRRNES